MISTERGKQGGTMHGGTMERGKEKSKENKK